MTQSNALVLADKFGLYYEVKRCLQEGFSTTCALQEWDIPVEYEKIEKISQKIINDKDLPFHITKGEADLIAEFIYVNNYGKIQ